VPSSHNIVSLLSFVCAPFVKELASRARLRIFRRGILRFTGERVLSPF